MNNPSILRCLAVFLTAAWMLWGTTQPASAQRASAVYYVAPDGDDANDGLAPEQAWRSLERVNTAALSPGDKVLFCRGGLWRGQLVPKSGREEAPITYGAYGEGAKPALLGSVAMNHESDWKPAGENLWTAVASDGQLPCDVGNIVFDHGAAWGIKRWTEKDLKADLDYWYDGNSHTVTLYSSQSPALRFKSIELALRKHIIDQTNRGHVVYENLALRYGAAHGIGGGNTHHIVVRDCDFSWIGGGHQHTHSDGTPIRFGNGVEFWANAHDCLVERCRLWEIYDAALTNQNSGSVCQQYNIVYRHNLIWNCEYSFEYWNRPEASLTHHIYFENNTCFGAGYGWGHAQRPDPAGRHLCFYINSAETRDVYIRNNIFCKATDVAFDALWWKPETIADPKVIRLDYNCWFQPEGQMIRFRGKSYTQAQFAAYQREMAQESHSLAADPCLVDASKLDFHLRLDSPCIDAGILLGESADFEGRRIPQGKAPDIGAFESPPQ